ncbi:MAG: S8 family peptidase [Candidatus Sericytochromatia bacterium]|nr:S8 family peptidase [Candidatus Sericytochromatia bacterium]
MRTKRVAALLSAVLVTAACHASPLWAGRPDVTPRGQTQQPRRVDPHSAIVRWKANSLLTSRQKALGGLRLATRRQFPALNATSVALSAEQAPSNIAGKLMATGLVDSIEPNGIWQLPARRPSVRSLSLRIRNEAPPDDPARAWGQKKIGLEAVWPFVRGDRKVVVAVIDTGVDLNHPDLRGALVPGYSTFDEPGPQDYQGHGTHVTGIIVGQNQGRPGVRGVAPGCRVMPVKVMGPRGREGRVENVVAGLLWAVDHGATIVNMSLGDEGTSALLRDAVRYAQEKDVLVVAASGNFEEGRHRSANTMNYPAAFPGVMAVGATSDDDQRADFSFYGHWMSIAAPGVEIYSSIPAQGNESGAYEYEQGTSMAAPFVSGVAALLRSRFPQWTARQVQQRLEKTAQDFGPSGFDEEYGHGRIDAQRALLGP